MGLISGLEKSPGGVHGNPLQYSCLENPRDRGAWRATVHGVAKIQTRLKQLIAFIDLAASGLSCGVWNLVAPQNVGS